MTKYYKKIINDSTSIATIDVENSTISVLYKYDRDFIDIVKKLDYSWLKPFWQLTINSEIYGNIEDRAAELGFTLLDNFINIEINNEKIFEMILNKTFKNRSFYWLILNSKKELKLVSYKKGRFSSQFLYIKYSNKEILGKWNNGGIVVNPANYLQIINFCDINSIPITKKAWNFLVDYAGIENLKTMKEMKAELCDD